MIQAEIRRTLASNPTLAEAWRGLAFQYFATIPSAASAAFTRAIALEPTAADWCNLGEARRIAGQPGASYALRRALVMLPDMPEAHNNFGNLLAAEERTKAAAQAFCRALALRVAFREAAYNLAAALVEIGSIEGAVRLFEALLGRFPDFIEARWNYALALLSAGRWHEGWRAHEVRRHHPELAPRRFPFPEWDGSRLAGRRILLAAEQGFGDTIQFLRFVPEVSKRGGRVVLDVPEALRTLVQTITGVEDVLASGDPLPAVDIAAPLMSLPLLLGLEKPQLEKPYLSTDPMRRERWRAEMAGGPRLRVGVAWAGNPAQRNDARRSLPDEALGPLANLRGVLFVSLQKGRNPPPGWLDVAPDLRDFAETAALIDELDLVISVDTAVAHLAGAIGKPLWVVLSPAADWRWPKGAQRSPWYPSATQFWRELGQTWEPTMEALAVQLAAHRTNSTIDKR